MASTELVPQDAGDDNDSGLNARQVQALEMLVELEADPAPFDEKTGKFVWDKDPKIRAYQMIYEGRFGGPNRGQGRPREPRAAEVIAEALREEPRVKKMIAALDRALTKKAGVRANLDAVKLGLDIERGEKTLQIQEEAHEDKLGNTREELLGTLFELVERPGVSAAIEGEATEITDAEVIEDFDLFSEEEGELEEEVKPVYNFQKRRSSSAGTNGNHGDSASSKEDGRNGRVARQNGDRGDSPDSRASGKPLIAVARRRAAERR